MGAENSLDAKLTFAAAAEVELVTGSLYLGRSGLLVP
jgi:hypothetical protein